MKNKLLTAFLLLASFSALAEVVPFASQMYVGPDGSGCGKISKVFVETLKSASINVESRCESKFRKSWGFEPADAFMIGDRTMLGNFFAYHTHFDGMYMIGVIEIPEGKKQVIAKKTWVPWKLCWSVSSDLDNYENERVRIEIKCNEMKESKYSEELEIRITLKS